MLLGPVGVIVGAGIKTLGAKVLIFWSQRRDSVKRRTLEQLRLARELMSNGDAAAAASALERCWVMALTAATNLRPRGIVRHQLMQSLTEAGLTQREAEQAVMTFDACDAVRFTGGPSSQLVEPLARTESFVEELCRRAARAHKMRGRHATA